MAVFGVAAQPSRQLGAGAIGRRSCSAIDWRERSPPNRRGDGGDPVTSERPSGRARPRLRLTRPLPGIAH